MGGRSVKAKRWIYTLVDDAFGCRFEFRATWPLMYDEERHLMVGDRAQLRFPSGPTVDFRVTSIRDEYKEVGA